jgi:hypothetical protein
VLDRSGPETQRARRPELLGVVRVFRLLLFRWSEVRSASGLLLEALDLLALPLGNHVKVSGAHPVRLSRPARMALIPSFLVKGLSSR